MELLGVMFLAVFLEGTLTYVFGKKSTEAEPRAWVKYVALLAGVGLAIGYKVNLPATVGITSTVPLLDFIVSGIIIGRGSNYLNDLVTSFKKK